MALAENIACAALEKQVGAMQFGTEWIRLVVARQHMDAVRA